MKLNSCLLNFFSYCPLFIFILEFCPEHISKTILAVVMKFRGCLQHRCILQQFAALVQQCFQRIFFLRGINSPHCLGKGYPLSKDVLFCFQQYKDFPLFWCFKSEQTTCATKTDFVLKLHPEHEISLWSAKYVG